MKLSAASDKEFETTVRAYSADLYRYAYWLCRDRFGAEELVQEAFLRAWRGWGGLREASATKAWLFTILRNEFSRSFSRKRLDISDVDVEELEVPEIPSSVANVEEMLEALPPGYREPLILQVLGGFSCREIAAMMNTSEGAIMTRLSRARQVLRPPRPAVARRKEIK